MAASTLLVLRCDGLWRGIVYTTRRAGTIAAAERNNKWKRPDEFIAKDIPRLLMNKAGHRLVTPTYTGLGERAHLAHPAIDLETHVTDMLQVIKYEDLSDVVLIGHSYGGMVATGVADRARDKVKQLIYIDAFVPQDGQSLLDFLADSE